MRQMYNCIFEVSSWGGSCFDPLFYYYPTDDQAFEHIDETYLVGGSLKVSPILEEGITQTKKFKSYFPPGRWVNLADFSQVVTGGGMVDLQS